MTHRTLRVIAWGVFSFGIVFLLLAAPQAQAAFGVSPPFIHATHLVPGATFTQTIYLVQNNPSEDLAVKTELEMDEKYTSWFSFNNGEPLVIPKGTRQFPLTITIKVPQDAPLSNQTGYLRIGVAPASTGGQISIALGTTVILNLSVGKDIYRDYTILGSKFLDIEEGWNPRVFIRIKNDGNVGEKFDSATFDLYDQLDAVRLAYAQKHTAFDEIPPFSTKEQIVEFPINFYLGVGQYWANVTFYKDDKIVHTQKATFNVLEGGGLSSPFDRILWSLGKYWLYYTLGGISMIIALVMFWRIRRGRIT